jgi:hypothetical protein
LRRKLPPLARLATAAVVASAAPAALGDGWSARLEPSYTNADTTTREANGAESRTHSSDFTQRYRLGLAQELAPLLHLDLNGYYEWHLGDTTTDGARTSLDSKTWNGDARLSLGNPTLSGSLGYTRQQQGSSTSTTGQVFRTPDVVREAYTGFVGWHPADLPALDLRASHTNNYDTARQSTDTTVDDLGISARYEPSRTTDLRYMAHFTNSNDHLRLLEQREISNAAAASWTDRLLDDRLAASATYNVQTRTSRTISRGGAAAIATVQPALRGLSTVEQFPTPERTSLVDKDNPALVDGATAATSASTGIDLGFGPALSGDTGAREMGLQLTGATQPVNLFYLWVDRTLPPEVVSTFQLEVYQSSDGAIWTRVDLTSPPQGGPPVQFSVLDDRFEIAFVQTTAPYVKVVTRPLSPAVTTDAQFTNIRVTELQALQAVAASAAARDTTSTSGNLSGAAKYRLTRGGPNLSYDFSGYLSHADGPRYAYSIVNGLSGGQRVWRIVELSGRVERADSAATGTAHEAVNRANLSAIADLLPTLSVGTVYTLQITQRAAGTGLDDRVVGRGMRIVDDDVVVDRAPDPQRPLLHRERLAHAAIAADQLDERERRHGAGALRA